MRADQDAGVNERSAAEFARSQRAHGHGTPGMPAVDIAFVFDTTGSMSNKIAGLVACLQDGVDLLADAGLDWRTTIVPFGDLTVRGDRIDSFNEWVYTVRAAKHMLGNMARFSGGSNLGESAIEAMLATCDKRFRPHAIKVVILLTDEPALISGGAQPKAVHRALSTLDALCFTVATDEPYYRAWATEHAGYWQPIGAHADTSAIIAMLRQMLQRVADVAASVHREAGGSVGTYMARSGRRRR